MCTELVSTNQFCDTVQFPFQELGLRCSGQQTDLSLWHLVIKSVRDTSVQPLGELGDIEDSERAQRRPAPPSRIRGIPGVIPCQR